MNGRTVKDGSVCDDLERNVTYAGFWVRAAAYVIDNVVVFAGLLIVRLLLSVVLSAVQGTVLGGNILFHYTLKDILLYVCQVLYFILCTYCTGTTLGKRAMNLRVVDADGEGDLSLLNVVYRETVGRFLCSLPAGIGYLIAGLDKEKRGIHDMLCDTRVVYAKKVAVYPVYKPMPGEMPAPEYMTTPWASQSGPYRFAHPEEMQKDTELFEEKHYEENIRNEAGSGTECTGGIQRSIPDEEKFLNREE